MKRLITIILSISIVFPMCTTVSLASPANVEYKDMIYLSDESRKLQVQVGHLHGRT